MSRGRMLPSSPNMCTNLWRRAVGLTVKRPFRCCRYDRVPSRLQFPLGAVVDQEQEMAHCAVLGFTADGHHLLSYRVSERNRYSLQWWRLDWGGGPASKVCKDIPLFISASTEREEQEEPGVQLLLTLLQPPDSSCVVVVGTVLSAAGSLAGQMRHYLTIVSAPFTATHSTHAHTRAADTGHCTCGLGLRQEQERPREKLQEPGPKQEQEQEEEEQQEEQEEEEEECATDACHFDYAIVINSGADVACLPFSVCTGMPMCSVLTQRRPEQNAAATADLSSLFVASAGSVGFTEPCYDVIRLRGAPQRGHDPDYSCILGSVVRVHWQRAHSFQVELYLQSPRFRTLGTLDNYDVRLLETRVQVSAKPDRAPVVPALLPPVYQHNVSVLVLLTMSRQGKRESQSPSSASVPALSVPCLITQLHFPLGAATAPTAAPTSKGEHTALVCSAQDVTLRSVPMTAGASSLSSHAQTYATRLLTHYGSTVPNKRRTPLRLSNAAVIKGDSLLVLRNSVFPVAITHRGGK